MTRASLALYVTTLLAGMLLPLQAGLNARLGRELSSPPQAAFISFAVGAIGLFAYVLLAGGRLPDAATLRSVPWWAWLGGLCGAVYVTVVILSAPRLGVATLMGLVVTGQMAASALIDQWGLLGLPIHPITPTRAIGLALIVGGVILVQRK